MKIEFSSQLLSQHGPEVRKLFRKMEIQASTSHDKLGRGRSPDMIESWITVQLLNGPLCRPLTSYTVV